jgi:hypothetical protein
MIEQTRLAGNGKSRLLRDAILCGTSNYSSCPSQYDSDEHREKSESPQRQSIDCTEPENLAPLSPHASHPFSGVLPRKIQ